VWALGCVIFCFVGDHYIPGTLWKETDEAEREVFAGLHARAHKRVTVADMLCLILAAWMDKESKEE
jgi:hypothetical protein